MLRIARARHEKRETTKTTTDLLVQHAFRVFRVLVFSCSFPAVVFAAVTDFIGKPIASVHLLIEGRETTDPTLVQVVETTAGQPLSMLQVRETIVHLYSLGQFEDVRVDGSLDGGGVTLRYDLTPIHAVTDIRFAGDTGRHRPQ